MLDCKYKVVIERGQDRMNDEKHDFIVVKLMTLNPERWLDIGCNTGWLLEEIGGGVGVDASLAMVEKARAKGLTVHHADATALPFGFDSFEIAVLSNVLHLIKDWKLAIAEASRVATAVIGIAEIPGTPWGVIGGEHKSVKAVVDPEEFIAMGGTVERINEFSYFFQL